MPEELKQSEINSQTDPSDAKQYDTETPKGRQFKELYALVDGQKIGLLSAYRHGVGKLSFMLDYFKCLRFSLAGQVGRSMAVAKRAGPDFLFLANAHGGKFSDLKKNSGVQITFQDSKPKTGFLSLVKPPRRQIPTRGSRSCGATV
jgi:hypothetical protein